MVLGVQAPLLDLDPVLGRVMRLLHPNVPEGFRLPLRLEVPGEKVLARCMSGID